MTPSHFRECLSSLGWSQARFADKTGVTPNTISRWMSGEIPQIPKWVDAYLSLALQVKQTADLIKPRN